MAKLNTELAVNVVMSLKIDIHTHIMPAEMPDFNRRFGRQHYLELHPQSSGTVHMYKGPEFFREVCANCFDPTVRLAECDQSGVDVQVLSTIPVLFNYNAPAPEALEISRFLNDHIASVVATQPRRFVGLGSLPLQDPQRAIQELERCMRELNLAGVEIGTHVNGRNLDDPELFPVLEAAQDLGAAVFVHPWDMRGAETIQKYWLPWLVAMPFETGVAIASLILGGVLEKLPKLRLAFAHGGGSFGCLIGRVEHGFQVRPDLCKLHDIRNPRDYLGQFYVDSLVHDPDLLWELIRLYGEQRVLLGSDYPFPLGEAHPGALIESLAAVPALKERLLGGNALEWLQLRAEQFGPGA